ncbi:hypothetical protein ACEQ6A_11200 [Rhizobium brockwellii]|uniref:hypothetical protein n=1 Tax=Rhizobium brockwellii TaxID=3019932 RepID=UPI003F967A32
MRNLPLLLCIGIALLSSGVRAQNAPVILPYPGSVSPTMPPDTTLPPRLREFPAEAGAPKPDLQRQGSAGQTIPVTPPSVKIEPNGADQPMPRLPEPQASTGSGLARANVVPAPGEPEVIYVEYRIERAESGSFLQKTLKEIGTKEAAAIIELACEAYGADCSADAVAMTEVIRRIYAVETGEGENHYGKVSSPTGYDICRAKIDWTHASIDGESTFNTLILRDNKDNGFLYYLEVPKNRKEGHSVKATVYLEFVAHNALGRHDCWNSGVNPWLCKGSSCSKFMAGAKK